MSVVIREKGFLINGLGINRARAGLLPLLLMHTSQDVQYSATSLKTRGQ